MPQPEEVNVPLFSSTPEHDKAKSTAWEVMVVDDDESVHATSNMVFRRFTFMGKGLNVMLITSQFYSKDVHGKIFFNKQSPEKNVRRQNSLKTDKT